MRVLPGLLSRKRSSRPGRLTERLPSAGTALAAVALQSTGGPFRCCSALLRSWQPTAPPRCLVSAAWAPAILLSPWKMPPGLSVTPGPRGPADPSGTCGLQMPLPQPQPAPDTGPRSGSQSPSAVSATFGSPMGQDW
ncbi:hypothetical protein NDU88_004125 [Pleurodeles waltl]|uniref:Uncharacterized protein n=1 Tax=Pleurodeles waltl TaxID=8319 RepID=A0AAV7WT78_PLEWA|nr:hypothetical protein NDU88_004125 [Pleurodeles waltl]